MGTTCIAITRTSGADMELLAFVLSCRVFGYGIEQSVLNHVKVGAARMGLQRIVGRYVPTPQNAPCKDFLSNNGFKEEGGLWIFHIGTAPSLNAEWLEVVVA
jgi:predicted enzyme involved in methoxymalonyl-ACP biosynthesis